MRIVARAILIVALATQGLAAQSRPAMQPAGSPRPLAGLPRTHTPLPTTAAIDVQDLMTRDYIIADDSMEGRDTGHPGGVRSTNYIASELKRLGLTPAGDHGTYFQSVPFTIRAPDTTSTLFVGARHFSFVADFLLLPRLGLQVFLGGIPFGGAFKGANVPTVWGGRIGDPGMVDPVAVQGKVVVFGLPTSASGAQAWRFWAGNGGDNLTRYAGARAVIVDIGDNPLPTTPQLRQGSLFYNDTTLFLLPVVIATAPLANELFGTTRSTGGAGKPISGRFGYVDSPTESPVRNVVGIIPGNDPKLRREYVAIGAHADHVGMMATGSVDHDSIRAFNSVVRPRGADDRQPQDANITAAQWVRINALIDTLHRAHGGARKDSIFNGADDDGSGTVLALEIAEWFAKARVKPARSLLFVWHAAEEKGLYGAEYFADHPTVVRDSIVTQINMDQMGRGGAEDVPPGGDNSLVILGARRLSAELGTIADSVNARPAYQFHIDRSFDQPGDPSSGWCRSDHYMYARYNIPVLFFVSAVWYIDYHMVSDEPQYVDYPRLAKVGNYIRDVVSTVANLPHRPVADHPKGNPDGVCVQ